MKDFIWFLETVDTGVDIGNYPMPMNQGSLEPGRHRPGQAQEEARDHAVEEDEMGGETRAAGTQPPRH
jgi:hypothetical protein